MKKLFAMFLALTMTFQLITPAWADAATEEPEEVTEASEIVEEVEEPEKDVPEEETTEVTEETLPEETTEVTEEETEGTEPTLEELPEEEEPIMEEVPEEEVALQYGEDTLASGSCGKNVNWVLTTDGTLTISGTGTMEIYGYVQDDKWNIIGTTAPWNDLSEKICKVVVNPGVNSIGSYAFVCCKNMANIDLSDSVTRIGGFAFYGCSSLTSVIIPEGVTEVGIAVFEGCSSLTSVTISNSVTSIGDSAFYGCSSLTSVTIPDRVTDIGEHAFYGCSSLTSMTIPEGVTSIGEWAFYGCSGLTSVTIPDSVTDIGKYAFYGCSSLTSVTIPKDVTNIGNSTFSGCSSLTSVTIPKGVTSIGEWTFYNCSNLTSVVIPKSVASIGNWAFSSCSELKNIYYSETKADWKKITIGSSNSCLTNATIHYGLDHICTLTLVEAKAATCTESGNNAYYCCTICGRAYRDESQAVETSVEAETLAALGHSMVKTYAVGPTHTSGGNNAYYTCSVCHKVYKDAQGTEETTVEAEQLPRLPGMAHGSSGDLSWFLSDEGVLTISGSGKMSDYSSSTSVPWHAFSSEIKEVVLEEGVQSIGKYAFSDCDSLTEMTIPEGVTRIGNYAFQNCSSLTDVTIPESVTSIESSTFSDCGSLTSVTIPEGVTSIGNYAFQNCTSLTRIDLPGSVKSIGNYVFSGCEALKEIHYDGPISTLKRLLNNAEVSSDVELYGTCLDAGTCGDNLTWVLDNDYKLIITGSGDMSNYYYYNVPWHSWSGQVKTVVFPSGLTSIGDYAFYDCSGLTSVTIPEGVASIGKSAFSGCNALTEIHYNGLVSTLKRLLYGTGVPSDAALYGTSLDEGNCGDNLSWILDNEGNLVITGSGDMSSFSFRWGSTVSTDIPWYFWREQIKTVMLPNELTSIGDYAFYDCKSLASIAIPENVVTIGNSTFSGCRGLTGITIPDSVTSIGKCAFDNCSSLTSVTIPDSVTSIGEYAFSGCSSLTSVTIPEGVTSIGERAFSGCSGLTSVTIPEGVTSIGEDAFSGCRSLISVTIPESVTSIGEGAFSGCRSLTSVTIPEGVTNIGEQAFSGCDQLADITFAHRGYDPLTIGYRAFYLYRDDPVYTTVHVPSVKTINPAIRDYNWTGREDGYYRENTREVTFEGSTQFPMLGIQISTQDGMDSYEQGVPVQFAAAPDPLDSTDDYVFSVNTQKSTAKAWISSKGVLTTRSTGTVTVRAACVQKPEIYDEITVTIVPPTGSLSSLTVTTMNDYPGEAEIGKPVQMVPVFTPENAAERTVTWSLENGTGTATIDKDGLLTPLTVGTVTVYATTPSGIEGSCTVSIQRYAESVTIFVNGHTDVVQLGVGETVELSAIIYPEDATTKDVQWSLANQTQIAELTVRDSGSWPYSKLTGKRAGTVLVTATAKDSKQVVAQKVLTITDSIRSYALPDGSGNLYYNTETGWITGSDETVQNVIIPGKIDGVTIVGISPYAFADRDSSGYTNKNETLASVSIPASITEIGEHAFDNCTAMSTLRFAAGSRLKKIGESAFEECSKLSSLTIPEGVEEIGKNAFNQLSGLKNLTVSGELDTRNCMEYGYYGTLDTVTLTGSYVIGKVKSQDGDYWQSIPGRNARKVILSESIQSIGDYAFSGYGAIEEVEIKGNLLTIGDYAFSNCNRLTTINLPDSLQSIGAAAFADCGMLSGIVLPNSLQALGKDCFMDCGELQIIDVSRAPDVFMEKRTYLTNMAVIPETLIRATNGKAEIKWRLNPVGESGWHIEASQDYETQEWYIYARESGQYRLICEDTYTGAQGSKLIEIKTGTVIRPADTGYLVSGGKLTLSAWNMPEETKANVFWSLAAGGQNYASIDDKGVLTAKTVYSARQVTVLARPYDGGETVSKTIWILPKTTGLGLLLDGAPLGSTLNVDQAETGTLALSAQVYPDGALQEVQWSSSAEEVARVDAKGLVTLAKPGTAVIKATTKDGSKLAAQVTLNVTFLDPSTTLTLTGEIPQPGLEPGQTVQLRLKGTMA